VAEDQGQAGQDGARGGDLARQAVEYVRPEGVRARFVGDQGTTKLE